MQPTIRSKSVRLLLKIVIRTTAIVLVAASSVIAQPMPSSSPMPSPPPSNRQNSPPPAPQPPPGNGQNGPPKSAPPVFGLPLPGLSGADLTNWNNGKAEFEEVATITDGLGPIFNGKSCATCHSVPALGGSSNLDVTRFGHSSGSTFDPLTSLGGSLLQEFAINPIGLEHVPSQANVTALRQSTALFGLGLIEAIPDATILAGVRTSPVDGVRGRAAMVVDVASGNTRVGRFGWKAQQATLLAFAGDAYVNEVGITNRLFPTENAPNGNLVLLKQLDKVPDPEDTVDPATGKAGIDRLADFMRLTSPPPPGPVNTTTAFGAKIFMDVGCATCHTPMMMTGTNRILALSQKPVMLWSDLLLHDMGSLADGIGQGAAGVKEMKTAPLWGVGASAPYLHDGRAPDLDTAIREHDGESATIRNRYKNLSKDQQQLLIEFLKSI